jgi:hypothetical protein
VASSGRPAAWRARAPDAKDRVGVQGERGLQGLTGTAGKGFAVIDSNEGYANVPAENVTGDIIFRRFP